MTKTLAVAAFFTAEPVGASLSFWLGKLGFLYKVEFAPFNQVLQQLLDPSGLFSRNRDGVNVILARYGDLKGVLPEFTRGLEAASAHQGAPHFIFLCPDSPEASAGPKHKEIALGIESTIARTILQLPGFYLVTSEELARFYPVSDYYNSYTEELGELPYTDAFLAALGTMICRKIHALKSLPRKVIALDCDQVLWKGVCGEDGPGGVELDPARLEFQRFMLEQRQAGMLLALCSRNNEADVWQVFERRPEMALKRAQLSASRLNWRPKSENLKSLAQELGLGLESFIFMDDSPVECAEVRDRCPEVLCLQWPLDSERVRKALRHVWAFDRLAVSREAAGRARFYEQNLERERLKSQALSLEEFLENLAMKVDMFAPGPEHLPRLAELSLRTNQFSFTTIRRSEAELKDLLKPGKLECFAVRVSDRFGDYGLVGAALFRAEAGRLDLDSLMLSCRALGRGIEHRMLARLGEIARGRNAGRVLVRLLRSSKNQPAWEFLGSLEALSKAESEGGISLEFDPGYLEKLRYEPGGAATPYPMTATGSEEFQPGTAGAVLSQDAALWQELSDAESVLKAMRVIPAASAAGTERSIQEKLLKIWEEVLGVSPIRPDDDFFKLGGDSLTALRLSARIEQAIGKRLPLSYLLKISTVSKMAETFDDASS
ncbi:MAG: HAD-IIIC family phosphatase [Elusimicrobia bacterium]|nr:HAD-IIIC family phosphatase [Elusimicrobiota bacterium]